jgi:hypothetical protein
MQTMKLVPAVLIAVPLLAGACGRRTTGSGEQARTEPAQDVRSAQTADSSGGAVGVVMDSIELGKGLSPDGDVTGQTTSFTSGDSVFAGVKVESLSPGTSLRLEWIGPEGNAVSTDEMVVPAEARVITLSGKDTSGWAPGTYRVQVAVGGADAGSKTFSIGQATTAD